MPDIRLIATDIDGTLLPSGWDHIPERTLNALQSCIDRGILVVPCSGRLISALPEDLMALRGIRWCITCNGASVRYLPTGECIYQRRLSADLAADLLRQLENYDVYACVYLPDGVYNRSVLPEKLKEHHALRIPFFSRNPQEDLPAFVEENGVDAEKIYVAVFSAEARERVRREFSNITGIHITSSSLWNLEINHAEAEKGRALAALSRYLDIPAENVLAMGDNENDYTMLVFAGTAIVPANGTDVIRELATQVVADCRRCGTAAWIEQNILADR